MLSDRIPHHPVETTRQTFEQLGLSAAILSAIREVGFEHPTPIQASVIPPALEGRELDAPCYAAASPQVTCRSRAEGDVPALSAGSCWPMARPACKDGSARLDRSFGRPVDVLRLSR